MGSKNNRDDILFPDLPRIVESLDGIPPEYHVAYLERDDGKGFLLSGKVAMVVKEGEAELARMKSEHEARMAAADREIEESKESRRKYNISTAIIEALTQAGIEAKWHKGIAALLSSQHEMQIEDQGFGPVVVANTPMGLKSIPHLVSEFLASDEGTKFSPRRSAPEAGYFSSLLADLKRAR